MGDIQNFWNNSAFKSYLLDLEKLLGFMWFLGSFLWYFLMFFFVLSVILDYIQEFSTNNYRKKITCCHNSTWDGTPLLYFSHHIFSSAYTSIFRNFELRVGFHNITLSEGCAGATLSEINRFILRKKKKFIFHFLLS